MFAWQIYPQNLLKLRDVGRRKSFLVFSATRRFTEYLVSVFLNVPLSKGTYRRLGLNDKQQQEFESLIEELDLGEKAKVIESMTSWEQKGFEEAFQQGFEQGRREGEIATARKYLHKVLVINFPADKVEEFMEFINQVEEQEVLDALFDLALDVHCKKVPTTAFKIS